MIFTARQLEEMYRSAGKVVLPYRARLTPLAQDWIRQKKIDVGYSDVESKSPQHGEAIAQARTKWLWWADGPCGPAKAALLTVARESNIDAMEVGVDPTRSVEAIKLIAGQLKQGKAAGAVILVATGATAMVYANRCPSIRAVLGSCIDAVSQAARQLAANVIVIEHPYKSLQQTKALLAQFAKAKGELSDDVKQQLSELTSCE